MTDAIMTVGAVTLALSYIVAAGLRAYVGLRIPVLRKSYWVSVIPCLGLSATSWWVLATQPVDSARIVFGQTWALTAVAAVYVRPATIALRDSWNTGHRR